MLSTQEISSLLTMYKAFIRSRLDYADVLYSQGYNSSFHEKLEPLQYNACLEIRAATRGTSSEKLYEKLGLVSLKSRHCFRKFCNFSMILNENEKSPLYLFDLVSNLKRAHEIRHSNQTFLQFM